MVGQVAQAAQEVQAGWGTLVAWSAVIAAVVSSGINTGSNWLIKKYDQKLERRKEENRVAHVKLDIMHQLEGFSNRCASYSDDIANAIYSYYDQQSSDAFARIQHSVVLTFEPPPRWEELDVAFVAPIKAMAREYENTNSWIIGMSEWADLPDSYEFEKERLAFYGLQALKIASDIARQIKLDQSGRTRLDATKMQFEELIEKRRASYAKTAGRITLIPELEAIFDAEMPDLKRRDQSDEELGVEPPRPAPPNAD
jgi:hypothetical protein